LIPIFERSPQKKDSSYFQILFDIPMHFTGIDSGNKKIELKNVKI